ncbi:hypothetical protein [Streptomyces sioyaensis]|uniref:hypothetical protein n=1 Tax=Streptomyces sioyaensis TaxID=67364 RepID=UPI003794BE50
MIERTYTNPTAPTVSAQQPTPADQQPPVDLQPTPAPQQVPPAVQPDSTLRLLVIGLLIAVLLLLAAGTFYVSLDHPSVAVSLQAMGSVLGAAGTIASIAVIAGRHRR